LFKVEQIIILKDNIQVLREYFMEFQIVK